MRVSAEAMEIDMWAVDLDIFHALFFARRAAGLQNGCEGDGLQKSGFGKSSSAVKTHKMTR